MAKKADKEQSKQEDKKQDKDDLLSKFYGDYDNYDWSGKQTDSGMDTRRKGSDR